MTARPWAQRIRDLILSRTSRCLRLVLGVAAVAAAVLGPPEPASALVLTGNQLANPGAEDGPGTANGDIVESIPNWTTTSSFTAVQYGASGGFPTASVGTGFGGGKNFFAGGPSNALATATQVVGVSVAAPEIDAGVTNATLSGYLGGFDTQGDNMVVSATYLDAGSLPLGSLTIGPVTAADRGNATTLLPRSQAGAIPAGTRSIRVVMTATRTEGSYNDGYADNLSLTLSGGLPPAPAATTGEASTGDAGTATLNGTVNPNGSATTLHFEYGTSTSYGSSTPTQSAGADTSNHPESASVSGLTPGTTYHFRIVATNIGGTSLGADQSFTTAAPPPPPPSSPRQPQLPLPFLAPSSPPPVASLPTLGETFIAEPLAGTVLISTPLSDRPSIVRPKRLAHAAVTHAGYSPPTRLSARTRVPVGSLLDTTAGNVRITTATDRSGGTQTGDFSRGGFQVLQGNGPETTMKLFGGGIASCPALVRAHLSRATRGARRQLYSSVRGNFRTRGHFSSATVRGTKWLTSESCAGTLTSVSEGTVLVRDLELKRNVLVHAGQSYFAREQGPRRPQ